MKQGEKRGLKVLGCTGGIGSGKSYVCNIFGRMGVPLYCSDDRTKSLYDTDLKLRSELTELLGEGIFRNGILDRKAFAGIIFSDSDMLQRVEAIVHPAVLNDFNRWKEEVERCNMQHGGKCGFVIFESALLLQKPLVRSCADRVLVVTAPETLRLERVMRRDNASAEMVRERMANQLSDKEMRAQADYVITADGKQALLPQIENIYKSMSEVWE